ncbi:hypothetical protein AB0I28_07440 [Phytomonospora sp. NPDC050363]|uniref:hypothetical protein n=1 Tax=Phytomonospora sp. NPDC050363 TaxID=3155642 RepID=UPI0033C66161
MRSARNRTLPLALAALFALSGCAKATVAGPPAGPPIEAVQAAAERLSEGFNYMGAYKTDVGIDDVNGAELPAEEKFTRSESSVYDSTATTSETIRIGDELWLRYDGSPYLPEGWGHLASGGGAFAEASAMIGPATWIPALLDEIVEIERVGAMQYEGVVDFESVDDELTGLTAYVASDVDDADEVVFRATLDVDGNLDLFRYELEGTARGTMEVVFSFTEHGQPREITAPDEPMTELTQESMVEWLLGGYGE